VKGSIPDHYVAQPGKALARWGDSGWGKLVKQGKQTDKRFDDALVNACLTMIREWNPNPVPTWVTCIPSRRHPALVKDFAQRLANGLSLPFVEALEKTDERPEQKNMANSAQQARNVDGALKITSKPLPGAVLLVDDMVDSRWTLTVASYLLRTAGSGPVWPLALAVTGSPE
jgi:ATP-dependent DNA helicase RecQ